MGEPAIVLMAPGERPTEPGWYVIGADGFRGVVEVEYVRGTLSMCTTASTSWGSVEAELLPFIAQIYPDRIGQE